MTADEITREVTQRVNQSLCSGCARARKPIDLWCWSCLLKALRSALGNWP